MSNNKSVWYFKAGESKVLSVKVPVKNGLFDSKTLKTMMGCENIESYSYTDPTGLIIVMVMNEMGLYEDTAINIPATQVLKKIKLNWGHEGFLKGNYIVYAYRVVKDEEDEYEEEKVDMPVKPFPQFIQEWNEAIQRSARATAEFFRSASVAK